MASYSFVFHIDVLSHARTMVKRYQISIKYAYQRNNHEYQSNLQFEHGAAFQNSSDAALRSLGCDMFSESSVRGKFRILTFLAESFLTRRYTVAPSYTKKNFAKRTIHFDATLFLFVLRDDIII